ncbi:hypothetical protein [Maribacter litoralis]|uniref:hypothetical protein n=1 Tax=Maribacter litoralis TaxID=2059726 RepID=UPI003F5CD504|tara:strand:+ start:131 stop:430 length:300 start_codon:yes stop_codon:yes gene_type:complete
MEIQIIKGQVKDYEFILTTSPKREDLPHYDFIYILAYFEGPGIYNMDKIESFSSEENLTVDIEKSIRQLFFYLENHETENEKIIEDIKKGNPLHKIGFR